MIEEHLRDLVPPERQLSPQRKHEIKEGLMQRITEEGQPCPVPRRRRRLIGGVVVAALASGGVAAATTIGLGQPDPEQSARVIRSHEEQATVHLDGWRPSLGAESVDCLGPATGKLTDPEVGIGTQASEFPLEEQLSTEILINECATRNDWARSEGGFDPGKARVCVRDGAYPLALVALEGLSCTEAGTGVKAMTAEDLDQLNRMRALEVAVLAVPEKCPTAGEAKDWARARLAEAGQDLAVRVLNEGDACYRGVVHWEPGEVLVQALGDQLQHGPRDTATGDGSQTSP